MNYDDHVELRKDCLRLVLQHANLMQITDPTPVAQRYYEWVCDVDKRRLKRQSESHAV